MVASRTEILDKLGVELKYLPRNVAATAYNKAVNYCPVVSGELVGSISSSADSISATLKASAPHAHKIEHGSPEVLITGDYIVKRKRHKRKTPTGTVTVRSHKATYKNSKPMKSGNDWYTAKSHPAYPGVGFLKRGMEEGIHEAIELMMRRLNAKRR